MIFISEVIGIIIKKNTLCKSKIRVIYFCPNCVNFSTEKVHFFFLSGGRLPSVTPAGVPTLKAK